MVNVIKMCLCWDIELIWYVCMWMECVAVKLNFENRIAYRWESASECSMTCVFGVGGVDQTAICATEALPPIQQAYANV